ncbi:MAG: hypothetical protein PHR69_07085, partial [Sphaerochaeta sp.]|nr:hypothetical protein [Sphaerochaeta sp.]
ALRVDTHVKTAIQPLQGCSAIFEECVVEGFARQVSHHSDGTDRTMHSGATSVRSILADNMILANLLLIISLIIVVSLIIR